MEVQAKRRYRALPLIASPLHQEDHNHGISDQTTEQNTLEKCHAHVTVHERTPVFREREEASSIELFYDLFFVANLTSFTNIHAIDDKERERSDEVSAISSYIGFFAILWFTWLQVVMFDVRFGVDSLFERVAKLIHFAVMVTFAIIGTMFDPSSPHETYATMRQLSLCLLVSRLVLICQYGSLMLWVKGHRKITRPLSIHIAAFGVGAVICFGFFFTFNARSSGKAYVVWYIIIISEALAVFLSSSRWRSISFQHTNLSERCGLLTLIILGEGIIVLTKSMSYVVKGENFSSGIIAQIISAVLIIYFVYMLYFDSRTPQPPSPTKHHFWALAHFPFHTALVLLMEGTSRFVTWRNAMEIVDYLYTGYDTIWESTNSTSQLADAFSNVSSNLLKDVEADPAKTNVTGYLDTLRNSGDASSDVAVDAAYEILLTLVNATLKFFKIQAAQKTTKDPIVGEAKDPDSDLGNALIVYDLVFLYFFVAAGLTLILMAVLMILNKKGRWVKGDVIGIAVRIIVGTGLALVALVKTNITSEEQFLYIALAIDEFVSNGRKRDRLIETDLNGHQHPSDFQLVLAGVEDGPPVEVVADVEMDVPYVDVLNIVEVEDAEVDVAGVEVLEVLVTDVEIDEVDEVDEVDDVDVELCEVVDEKPPQGTALQSGLYLNVP
ncbi:MAG: hypothetical protein Q9209_004477 [Squamulea sp. 1 TL-2023]